MYIKNLINRF